MPPWRPPPAGWLSSRCQLRAAYQRPMLVAGNVGGRLPGVRLIGIDRDRHPACGAGSLRFHGVVARRGALLHHRWRRTSQPATAAATMAAVRRAGRMGPLVEKEGVAAVA